MPIHRMIPTVIVTALWYTALVLLVKADSSPPSPPQQSIEGMLLTLRQDLKPGDWAAFMLIGAAD